MLTCTTSSLTLAAVHTKAKICRGRSATDCTMLTGRVTKEKAAASAEPSGGLAAESPLAVNSAGVAARAACSRAASVFTLQRFRCNDRHQPLLAGHAERLQQRQCQLAGRLVAGLAGDHAHGRSPSSFLVK